MPIYEYRCDACGTFEEMQRISDPPLTKCPKCKRKVRRLISSTSFQLKGTGWYVTDYARSGSGGNGKKSGGDAKADTPADTKTETTKTETKSESKPSGASADKASTDKS
jgi:putative FmdB family regulatory protein